MKVKKLNLKYENYCLQCGKKFKTHKSNIKVCSPKCALERKRDKDRAYWQKYYENNKDKILEKNRSWWKDNHEPHPRKWPYTKRTPIKKECATCHIEFETTNSKVEHCLLHRFRRYKAGVYTKDCIYCGVEFLTESRKRVVCMNPECIDKFNKHKK